MSDKYTYEVTDTGKYYYENNVRIFPEQFWYIIKKLENEIKSLNEYIDEITEDNERLEQLTSQFKVGDIVNLKSANQLIDEQRKTIKDLQQQREELFIRERDTKNNWRQLRYENEQLKKEKELLIQSLSDASRNVVDILMKGDRE